MPPAEVAPADVAPAEVAPAEVDGVIVPEPEPIPVAPELVPVVADPVVPEAVSALLEVGGVVVVVADVGALALVSVVAESLPEPLPQPTIRAAREASAKSWSVFFIGTWTRGL